MGHEEHAPVESDAAEAVAVRATSDDNAYVQQCHRTLDDAEESCVPVLDDVLDDIFDQLRVQDENERVFHTTARLATEQLWDAVCMGGMPPEPSLDQIDAGGHDADAKLQYVKTNPDVIDSQNNTVVMSPRWNPTKRKRPRTQVLGVPPLPFLRALLEAFVDQAPLVHQLLSRSSHSIHVVATSTTDEGRSKTSDWELPCTALTLFLDDVVKELELDVLPSAVDYVVHTNRSILDKKAKAHLHLQLEQIRNMVHKAVMTADQAVSQAAAASGTTAVAPLSKLDRSMTSPRIFQQTEVTEVSPRAQGWQEEDLLYSCYDEGRKPTPTPVDRYAPGAIKQRVVAVPTVSARALASKILMALKATPPDNTQWGMLRKKVVMHGNTLSIAVESTMSLDAINEGSKPSSAYGWAPARLKKQPTQGMLKHSSHALMKQSTRALFKKDTTKSLASKESTNHLFDAEPDTATLTNIFSLGTPRQLSAEEMARRNDILAVLERQEQHAQRRLATASILSMSMPPFPLHAPNGAIAAHEREFQAYVAQNSSIVVPAESHPYSPTKPANKGGKRAESRKQFELGMCQPDVHIADGNTHTDATQDKTIISPIRRARLRDPRDHQGGKSAANSPTNTKLSRLDTLASSPLVSDVGPPTAHLPEIDTSRLAAGVRAVVRGVEKRGPRQNPSRESRLKSHNYKTEESGTIETAPTAEPPPKASPTKTMPPAHAQPPQSTGLLPIIPPVSPIKASPKRRQFTIPAENLRDTEVEDPVEHDMFDRGSRRFPAKQPVWEKRTSSPPRMRHKVFSNSPPRRKTRLLAAALKSDEENELEDQEKDRKSVTFARRPNAPRKNVLQSPYNDDE